MPARLILPGVHEQVTRKIEEGDKDEERIYSNYLRILMSIAREFVNLQDSLLSSQTF